MTQSNGGFSLVLAGASARSDLTLSMHVILIKVKNISILLCIGVGIIGVFAAQNSTAQLFLSASQSTSTVSAQGILNGVFILWGIIHWRLTIKLYAELSQDPERSSFDTCLGGSALQQCSTDETSWKVQPYIQHGMPLHSGTCAQASKQ